MPRQPISDPGTPTDTGVSPAIIVSIIQEAIDSNDVFLQIDALQLFQQGRPEGIPQSQWTEAYLRLTGSISRQMGVSRGDVGVANMQMLNLYRDVFQGAQVLQTRLSGGQTAESMTDQAQAWVFSLQQLQQRVGANSGALANRVGILLGEQAEAFDFLSTTFAAAGVGITPPELPTSPDQLEDGIPLGAPSGEFGGGGASSFESTSTSQTFQELRVPTAQEFLADFDNAFLVAVGNLEGFLPDQIESLRERRDELLSAYVTKLGAFALEGESPFTESTRGGLRSETESSTESTTEDGRTVQVGRSLTTQFGEETDAGPVSAGAFLMAKLSPTDFLTELFPTEGALKTFAEGDQPSRSRLPDVGFVGSTQFQRRR